MLRYDHVDVDIDRSLGRGPDHGPRSLRPAAGHGRRAPRRGGRARGSSPRLGSSTTPSSTCGSTRREVGTWILLTSGDPDAVAAAESVLDEAHWLARETRLYWARTLKRLDVSARTLVALVEPGSCCTGTLAELAFAADRTYMLDGTWEGSDAPPPVLKVTAANDGWYPMSNGLTRLATRFWGRDDALERAREQIGKDLRAAEALDAGLITFAFDDLDWEDEVRLLLEERNSFSPDALTGTGGQQPLRRPRDDGDEDLRPAVGLAELDLPAPERRRARRRPAPLRHRDAPDLRPREGVTAMTSRNVDIDARIPNNVDLAGDRRLQRALESWQPKFIEWWKQLGPVAYQDNPVYLRTAVDVGQEGWANFGHVEMPDYRWGIFLAEPEPDRRIAFGEHKGEPVWHEVPGRAPRRPPPARSWCRATPSRRRSSSSATCAPPHRASTTSATCSRSTSRRAATSGRWCTSCTATSAATAATRPTRCSNATPATPTSHASSAPSTSRHPTGCRSSCSRTSPTATASSSSPRCASRPSTRCRAPATSC